MYNSRKLRLNDDIGSDRPANEEDTLNVKSKLYEMGYYEEPEYGFTPYPDQPMFDGIKQYQKDHKLKVDGIMKPGGETEQSVNKESKNTHSPKRGFQMAKLPDQDDEGYGETEDVYDKLPPKPWRALPAACRELQNRETEIRKQLDQLNKNKSNYDSVLGTKLATELRSIIFQLAECKAHNK